MTARLYDSSKTRVAPVFDQLVVSGDDWIRQLLHLPQFGAPTAQTPTELDLTLMACHWGDSELGLPAPKALLHWLIDHLSVEPANTDTRISAAKRRLLIAMDQATVALAHREVDRDSSRGSWWVLEGPTYPDVVIETAGACVVIEGKRTERGPTTSTTWMRNRHQMLRHMDAAWEIRGSRRVYGFFIVEADGDGAVPQHWRDAAVMTRDADVLSTSLPHRTADEQDAISAGFLGVTTWQAVCQAFGIDQACLPDTVAVG